MKKTVIVISSLVLLLLLAACAANAPTAEPVTPTATTGQEINTAEPTSAAPTATAAPGTNIPADVAALVNGTPIPLPVYQAQLAIATVSFAQQPGFDSKTADGQTALAALRGQVLDWLIDQLLIDQAAARMGIKVDDARLNAEVDKIRQQNPTGYADWLKQNGFTEQSFREQTRSDLLGQEVLAAVTKDVGGKMEQVHLRQILLDDEATARSVADKLRKGSDFAALAKQYSKDEATKANGGDMGFLPRGILPDALESVAFGMQPGQTADPVHTDLGWHIVQLVAKDPAREVTPDVLNMLRQDKFMKWLDEERGKAQIQVLVPVK
jgi:parvulin-like peptidyl-prolyl isomerase